MTSTIRNIQFRGTVEVDGFAEHYHLLNVNAATNVAISSAIRPDGEEMPLHRIKQFPGTERHNKQFVIEESVFDGINNDNRNAISVIDGEGIEIKKNSL